MFSEILDMMATDWQDNAANHHDLNIMMRTANVARKTSSWIIGVQVASVIFYSLGVLSSNAGDPTRWEPHARELILKMEFPFNISTHSIYAAITALQFYHLMLVGCGITIVNSLLVTLVSPKCTQRESLLLRRITGEMDLHHFASSLLCSYVVLNESIDKFSCVWKL